MGHHLPSSRRGGSPCAAGERAAAGAHEVAQQVPRSANNHSVGGAVKYHDHRFHVDERDQDSKITFGLLLAMTRPSCSN